MGTKTLYRITELGEFRYLTDSLRYIENEATATAVAFDDVCPQELAEYLDAELENANQHDFVGCHVYILESLKKIASIEVAKQFLWKLFQDGGFDEVLD